jgi:hypothetical protein
MGTKQNTAMTFIPMDNPEELTLAARPDPDSKEYLAIFNEQQRHQWIMQAQHDKTNLAATLAAEINKHMTREVRELIEFMYAELQQVKDRPEVHAVFLGFIQQDGRAMMTEMSALRKSGVHGIVDAVTWSLNVLPPEEHRSFWDWLLGRKK